MKRVLVFERLRVRVRVVRGAQTTAGDLGEVGDWTTDDGGDVVTKNLGNDKTSVSLKLRGPHMGFMTGRICFPLQHAPFHLP